MGSTLPKLTLIVYSGSCVRVCVFCFVLFCFSDKKERGKERERQEQANEETNEEERQGKGEEDSLKQEKKKKGGKIR